MGKSKIKISYIYHSGFALESENYLLIFDYYKEPVSPTNTTFISSLLASEEIKGKKKVFVFSSHSHGDHFNPDIFNFIKYNPDITYILSNDIVIKHKNSNCIFLGEDDKKVIGNLKIRAFGSTDIGISFLVMADNINIFHAGDLNWWHWKEDTLYEQQAAERNFKAQIEKIKNEVVIDVAFFPVDPRLEEFYYLGGQYFAEKLRPKLFVPMHFGENKWITKEFSHRMDNLGINSVEIANSFQEFYFTTENKK